ncbi:MAG TPA: hypothetical protein VGN13_12365 [Solirubrobacteraceae bacterium]|jgi:GH24 family phage-related lysozyme (muramidase)
MRKSLLFAVLLAALIVAGCGSAPVSPRRPAQLATTAKVIAPDGREVTSPLIPAASIIVPPQSSRVPTPTERKQEGPMPVGVQLGSSRITIDEEGLQVIGREEGYERCAYFDPFGGVYTVGFGQTRLPNGRPVYAGFCFASYQAALNNLSTSVRDSYEWAVREACGNACGQHQYNALDDLAYNVGAYVFRNNRALFDDVHRGAFFSACSIMRGYDIAGGQYLSDLARRRGNECREIEKPIVRPETPAQRARRIHGERVARLHRDYRRRSSLNHALAGYKCLRGYDHKPRHVKHACTKWRNAHARINRDIARLHREGIR